MNQSEAGYEDLCSMRSADANSIPSDNADEGSIEQNSMNASDNESDNEESEFASLTDDYAIEVDDVEYMSRILQLSGWNKILPEIYYEDNNSDENAETPEQLLNNVTSKEDVVKLIEENVKFLQDGFKQDYEPKPGDWERFEVIGYSYNNEHTEPYRTEIADCLVHMEFGGKVINI